MTKTRYPNFFIWLFTVVGWISIYLISSGIIPKKVTKTYDGERIIYRSWHNVARIVVLVSIAIIVISVVWLTVLRIIEMVKQDKKTTREAVGDIIKLLIVWGLICLSLFMMSVFLYIRFTLRYEGDTYFEYIDGDHTIVIEETSFLLSGYFSVFQINEDSTATYLGGDYTDDGYRNEGNYKFEWFDEYVKITYCDGISRDSYKTIECKFK